MGCGALGSVIADLLTRAGVGTLTLIDRDIVELTNLQRQTLYDETDVAKCEPKAEAAARKLRSINSSITIRPIVDDLNAVNAARIFDAAQPTLLIDGLDNFETRYLLNDLSVSKAVPYVYAGAVGTGSMTATFLPHSPAPHPWPDEQATPCLRCVFPEPPPPGSTPTCDTAGVLGPLTALTASLQAAEALKIMVGDYTRVNRSLLTVDLWTNEFRRLDVASAWRQGQCPCCGRHQFDFLHPAVDDAGGPVSLCGRNAVQVQPSAAAGGGTAQLDFPTLAARLSAFGTVTHNPLLLRAQIRDGDSEFELTLFPTGRAIIKGTTDPGRARALYARYIGA